MTAANVLRRTSADRGARQPPCARFASPEFVSVSCWPHGRLQELIDDLDAPIVDDMLGSDADILREEVASTSSLDALMALEEYTPLVEGLAAALPVAVKKAKASAEKKN